MIGTLVSKRDPLYCFGTVRTSQVRAILVLGQARACQTKVLGERVGGISTLANVMYLVNVAPAHHCLSLEGTGGKESGVWLGSYKGFICQMTAWASWDLGSCLMGLLPDTQNWGCACAGNAGNVFPVTASKRSRHASRHVRHARAVMHAGIAN